MTAKPPQVVIEPLPIQMTPIELYSSISRSARNSFLLESAVGAQRTVSYSFIGCSPKFVLRCESGKVSGGGFQEEDPIGAIKKVIRENQIADRTFSFMGGLVGYFSYEFARYLESKVPFFRDQDFPDYELGLYKEAVIYDHSHFRCYYLSIDGNHNLKRILDRVKVDMSGDGFQVSKTQESHSRADFQHNVDVAKQRIREGEAFQIVLSRQKEFNYIGEPLQFYRALREVNPSPYMFFLDFGERKVLGSSPETLVTVKKGDVITFPIAGTRPIGSDMRQRRAYKEDMRQDEKERAEHAMLVDLARNDLGKVCEDGSVHVAEYMQVQEFSHVQHLVSKVQGSLDQRYDAFDAFCAVFPAGTVSGAPKPRAMEIISQLEGRPRGPYAGSVAYLSLNGDLDSAISIRSAFVNRDKIRFQAGSGIVYDSIAEKEFVETENKLGALTTALERSETKGALP